MNPQKTVELVDIPIASIRPSRWQHRRRWDPEGLQELAQSIQEHGLINRVLVFADENGENYEIIAGERRLRALSALALLACGDAANLELAIEMVADPDWYQIADVLDNLPGTVPCELRDGVATQFREIVIVDNLQRENCTAIEEAEAFQTLIQEDHYTHASLAKRLGKSRAYITQRIGLLGLSEDVRDVVDDEGISFTAARSIATLPEDVQPAVAAHVQDLAQREGDSQATTRKVQAMARQINTFLDPENWQPPAGEVIGPLIRNRLRLVRHVLRTMDRAQLGEAVIALRQVKPLYGYGDGQNLVGKKPMTLVQDTHDLRAVLNRLTSKSTDADGFWAEAARVRDWQCIDCRFYGYSVPIETFGATHCLRWNGDGDGVDTCPKFIGHTDPLVIPINYNEESWAKQLDVAVHAQGSRGGGFSYLDDVDVYRDLHERAAEAYEEEATQKEMAKTESHLPALRSYCGAQAEKKLVDLPFSFGHAQAHRCTLCVHHRPELLGEDLPPCHFAVEPLSSRYGDETVAPGQGALVSKDGLLIPRCMQFRHRAVPRILPLEGFRFPSSKDGRGVVLHWLRSIAGKGSSGNVHDNTLAGPLAWLPYDREKGADLEAMLRHVRDAWEDLGGDEIVARLISIALTEATVAGSYHNKFDLMNPLTGRTEKWASVNWHNIREGKAPYGFPKDWPTPWVPDPEDEDGD